MENLSAHLEALIFASENPITLKEIGQCIASLTGDTYEKSTLQNKITAVQQKYWANSFPFSIEEVAGGYQFQTKENYHDTISILLKQKSKKKLSKASLETLSLIAYKQPITKSEIERIRGVSCDYAVRKLLEKELIQIKGRSDDAGRPLIYATSEKFMQHFGLKSIKELPKLREFKEEENQIGTITEE